MSFNPEKEKIANKFVEGQLNLIEMSIKEIIGGLESEDVNTKVNALNTLSEGICNDHGFKIHVKENEVLSYFSIIETLRKTPIEYDYEVIDEIIRRLSNIYRDRVCELAFTSIVDGLYDEKYTIVISTLGTLKVLNDSRAVYPLLSFLNESSGYSPILLDLLIQFKDEATKPLLELQDSDNKFVRRFVASYIGQIRHFDSYDVLINFLDDADWNVRFKAIVSMGQLGDERTIEDIARCTQDKSANVRRKAAEVIGILASGERISTIEEIREKHLEEMEKEIGNF